MNSSPHVSCCQPDDTTYDFPIPKKCTPPPLTRTPFSITVYFSVLYEEPHSFFCVPFFFSLPHPLSVLFFVHGCSSHHNLVTPPPPVKPQPPKGFFSFCSQGLVIFSFDPPPPPDAVFFSVFFFHISPPPVIGVSFFSPPAISHSNHTPPPPPPFFPLRRRVPRRLSQSSHPHGLLNGPITAASFFRPFPLLSRPLTFYVRFDQRYSPPPSSSPKKISPLWTSPIFFPPIISHASTFVFFLFFFFSTPCFPPPTPPTVPRLPHRWEGPISFIFVSFICFRVNPL